MKENTYNIERDFNKNTFRLINVTTTAKRVVSQINGKAVDGSNLGKVLFEIGRSSFRRSAYIPQDEIICSEVESELNDKLRNLINATDENHSLDKSLGILQKAADSIETKRGNKGKLREAGDRIGELRAKISECRICLDNAEREREELKKLKERLKECEVQIEKYDSQIRIQNETETVYAQQKHYGAIKESVRSCEEKIEKLIPFFGEQNIDDIDVDRIKDKIDAYYKQKKAFKDKEDETLAERSRLFSLEEVQIDEIDDAGNADNQNKLADLKAMLSKEEELLGQIEIELKKVLSPFDCSSREYSDCFHEIKENYNDIKKAKSELKDNEAKLKEFLKGKDAAKLIEKIEIDVSVEELEKLRGDTDQKRLQFVKDIAEAENRINRNDEIADELSDYESELSACEEYKERLTAELEAIRKTIEYLHEANDNLANQYLMPLMQRMRNLISLYDEQKSDLEFDANSKIMIKEKGKDRAKLF